MKMCKYTNDNGPVVANLPLIEANRRINVRAIVETSNWASPRSTTQQMNRMSSAPLPSVKANRRINVRAIVETPNWASPRRTGRQTTYTEQRTPKQINNRRSSAPLPLTDKENE
jgi:hypothetical protein